MRFLEFVTDEKVLRELYDNFLDNVNQLSPDEYHKRSTSLDKIMEEFESRLDELADNQPYGTHCETTTTTTTNSGETNE